MNNASSWDKGFSYESDINPNKFPKRKVWIQTYGCQMNYSDTERVLSHLKNFNFSQADCHKDADLYIFNTCAIRDHANQRFYSHLGEMVHIKKIKDIKIGICGCIAQIETEKLLKRYPYIDFSFGTDAIDELPSIIERTYGKGEKIVFNDFMKDSNYSIETRINHGTPQAFVNIIKGCNNFCTYCIVPYTRGREISRRLKEVVDDIQRLVRDKGIEEITLLGQNVNSFGKENGETFPELIDALENVQGLKLLRYTTSHPYDMSNELINAHRTSSKLANHVHLPLQSGSNSVLKRMNRKYTIEHYVDLIERLRAVNSNLVITSDIIAGFPNETEDEHQDTMKALQILQFDSIYAYAFSPRPGTKASELEEKLTNEIRHKRLLEIQKKQLEIQGKIRSTMIGKTYKVLVDGVGNMKGIKKWKGRTSCMRIVHFVPKDEKKDYLWNWVDLEITSTTSLSCQGKLV